VEKAVKQLERVMQLLSRLKDSTSDGIAQGRLDALLEEAQPHDARPLPIEFVAENRFGLAPLLKLESK
jgi:hypothetical protein